MKRDFSFRREHFAYVAIERRGESVVLTVHDREASFSPEEATKIASALLAAAQEKA